MYVIYFQSGPQCNIINKLPWVSVLPETTAIKRRAVRETGVCRHHGGPIEGPLKPPYITALSFSFLNVIYFQSGPQCNIINKQSSGTCLEYGGEYWGNFEDFFCWGGKFLLHWENYISISFRYPHKPFNTIVLWCMGVSGGSLIGPPWCRETPVSRTATYKSAGGSFCWASEEVACLGVNREGG